MLTVRSLRSWEIRRNDISNSILQEMALFFWHAIIRLFPSFRNCFMCCLSFRRDQYFWIVGSVKHWNRTVKLTSWGYSQEFDNIFSSDVESERCHPMTQNSVIVHEINTGLFQWGERIWDEWPHIKYFGTLINLLKLIDVSPLLLTLNDA